MTTGEKIKEARKKAGLSQKELGDKLGVSQAMIGQYETGKRKPKLETLDKIAEALSVDVWDFYAEYELEENPLNKSKQLSSLFKYLDTLGYEFVDGAYYNAPLDEIGMLHIKDENLDIPLTQEDFDKLEHSIKDDVTTEIYRLRKEKNI